MAYKLHYTLPFRTLHKNTLYTINIYEDGYEGNDIVELTGAEEPFNTQMDDDDDFTKAYRGQTGNLNIVTSDRSLLKALMPATPTSLIIKLFSGKDADTLEWTGFIKQEAFSQSYLSGTYELSIPIISVLGLFAETDISGYYEGLVTWEDYVICKMQLMGDYAYSNYICPDVSESNNATWLKDKGFLAEAFKELKDFDEIYNISADAPTYDPETYGDVMDDYLKLYGYVLYEDHGSIIMRDVVNTTDTYISRAFINDSEECSIEEEGTTYEATDVLGLTFASNDNTEEYVIQKHSVSIDEDEQKPDTLFDLDDVSRLKGVAEPISDVIDYSAAFRATQEITPHRYNVNGSTVEETSANYQTLLKNSQYGGEVGLAVNIDEDNNREGNFGLFLKSTNLTAPNYVTLLKLSFINCGIGYYRRFPTSECKGLILYSLRMTFKPHYTVNSDTTVKDLGDSDNITLRIKVTIRDFKSEVYYKTKDVTIYKDGADIDLFEFVYDEDEGNEKYYDFNELSIEFLDSIYQGISEMTGKPTIILTDFKIAYSKASDTMDDDCYEAYSEYKLFPATEITDNSAKDDYSFKTKFSEYFGGNPLYYADGDRLSMLKGVDPTYNSYGAPYLSTLLMQKYLPVMSKPMRLLKLDVRNDLHVTDNVYWDGDVFTVLAIERSWWEEKVHVTLADLGKTPKVDIPDMALANGYVLGDDQFNNPDSENPIKAQKIQAETFETGWINEEDYIDETGYINEDDIQ